MIEVKDLMKFELDPIPKYLIMRDLLKIKIDSRELKDAKNEVLKTKWVNDIIKLQWDDGSWGRFHSMSTLSKMQITTERALRRLLILGLDKADRSIYKALTYMKKYLNRDIDLRDRKEKKHDWDLLTRLFVATWILKIDPSNRQAKEIAENWAKVITHAFSGNEYNHRAYKEAYNEIHKPEKGKVIWGFQNFYLVAILPGVLSSDIESKFLDYIMNSEKGIYYIYDENLRITPKVFSSRQASRYIYTFELLSNYSLSKSKSKDFINWVNENNLEDGFWDMGKIVKDNMQYPLSDSWRKVINRKIDSTIRIQRVLSQL